MPHKRLRKDARSSTNKASDNSKDEVALVAATGLTGAVGLLAWCWVQNSAGSLFLPPGKRFARVTPSDAMASQIAPFLENSGLLARASAPERSAFGDAASAERFAWVYSPKLVPASSRQPATSIAETTAVMACHQLRREPTFLTDAARLWRVLVIDEVIAFLEAELADHKFDPAWAIHVQPIIDRALDHLSASQCFYLCWLSVRDLASAYLRLPHARDRLDETLRWSLNSKLAKAHSERWSLREFGRHANRDESAIAHAFSFIVDLGSSYLSRQPTFLETVRIRHGIGI